MKPATSLALALAATLCTSHADRTAGAISPADWSGIRAAYDASRHAAFPQADGTFTVTFAPLGGDSRTATLSIPNNDPDESPFLLTPWGFYRISLP